MRRRYSRTDDVASAPNPTAASERADLLLTHRATRRLAVALLTVDVLLLAANLMHLPVDEPHEPYHPIFSDPSWNGDLDWSYIEIFGAVQLVLAVVALLMTWATRRSAVYAVWALVLATVAADDLFMLHERASAPLSAALGAPVIAGLRPVDLGELGAWAIAVAILAPLLLVAHLRARGAARRDSRTLAVLMAALALFAVVLDMLHIMVEPHVPPFVNIGMTLAETAGELVIMTGIAVVTHRMALSARLDR